MSMLRVWGQRETSKTGSSPGCQLVSGLLVQPNETAAIEFASSLSSRLFLKCHDFLKF